MTNNEVIELMLKFADSLEADLNRRLHNRESLPRMLSAILTGPLPHDEVKKLFRWLQGNEKDMLEPLKEDYNELLSCAQEVDRYTDPSKIMSNVAMRIAQREYGRFLHLDSILVTALRDTAEELAAEKPEETEQRIEAQEKDGQSSDKTKRKTKCEKIALIAAHLKERPYAFSPEITKATGINQAEVRRLWRPIKKELRKPKRAKRTSLKDGDISQAIDETAECSICCTPKRELFECSLCNEIITMECRECHYTNSHPEDATP